MLSVPKYALLLAVRRRQVDQQPAFPRAAASDPFKVMNSAIGSRGGTPHPKRQTRSSGSCAQRLPSCAPALLVDIARLPRYLGPAELSGSRFRPNTRPNQFPSGSQ